MTTHFEAAEVLAGAYQGRARLRLERGGEIALLVHVVEVDDATDTILRVLCRRVKVEHLTTDAGPTDRWPTCPTCEARLVRLAVRLAAR